jgi:hypothetical protein
VPSNDTEKQTKKQLQDRIEKQMKAFIVQVICNEACIFSENCLEASTQFYATFSSLLMKNLVPADHENPVLPLAPTPPGKWDKILILMNAECRKYQP